MAAEQKIKTDIEVERALRNLTNSSSDWGRFVFEATFGFTFDYHRVDLQRQHADSRRKISEILNALFDAAYAVNSANFSPSNSNFISLWSTVETNKQLLVRFVTNATKYIPEKDPHAYVYRLIKNIEKIRADYLESL